MAKFISLFIVITILTSAVVGGAVYYWQLTNINKLIDQNQADKDQLSKQIQDLQKQLANIQADIDNQPVTVYDEEQQFQTPDITSTDQIGFIKSIENVSGEYYVNIDYIVTFNKTSADGIKARIEDGICKSEEDCDMHPGTYIRNNNSLIRKFKLLDTTNLNMVSELRSDKKYMVKCLETIPQGRKVTIEELSAYIEYLNQLTVFNDTYFRIKLNFDNKITELYEQTFCLP